MFDGYLFRGKKRNEHEEKMGRKRFSLSLFFGIEERMDERRKKDERKWFPFSHSHLNKREKELRERKREKRRERRNR